MRQITPHAFSIMTALGIGCVSSIFLGEEGARSIAAVSKDARALIVEIADHAVVGKLF